MKKLCSLIEEVKEITYGKGGARWRNSLYETDRMTYHLLRSDGSLYEKIHEEELKSRKNKPEDPANNHIS